MGLEQDPNPQATAKAPVRARRVRQARPGVKLAERLARTLISVAGFGTIVAVGTICLFLVWVVAPLFFPAKVGATHSGLRSPLDAAAQPRRLEIDEYRALGWILDANGALESRRLDTAELLERVEPFGAQTPTAAAFARGAALFGFEDGSLRYGRIGFQTRILEAADVPEALRALSPGALAGFENGLIGRTPEGQFRAQRMQVEMQQEIASSHASRVVLIDHTSTQTQRRIAALHADGTLALYIVTERTNLMTGEVALSSSEGTVPYKQLEKRGDPRHMLLASGGSSLYLVWSDGLAERYDTRDLENLKLAEIVDLAPEPDVEVSTITTLLGETSLVVGDSSGRTCV